MGQPVDRVPDDLDVGDGPCDGLADALGERVQAPALVGRPCHGRLQRGRGGDHRGQVGEAGDPPALRSSPGSGARHRTPVRTASTPTPGGPPHLCALAVRTDHPLGTGARPTLCAASTSKGIPCARQAAATSATGCTVPTSWLADCSAARTVSGPSARANRSGSTRPRTSTPTRCGPSAPGSDPQGGQDAGVLDGRAHDAPPHPPPAPREARDTPVHGLGAGRGEGDLFGAAGQDRGHRLAGPVEQQPGLPRRR